MSKNNINEIANLSEELETKFKFSLKNEPSQETICNKARSLIFKRIQKLESIVDSKIKKELRELIEGLVANELFDIDFPEEIRLMFIYKTKRDLKGLREKLDFPQKSALMQELYKKELESNSIKDQKLKEKREVLKDKADSLSRRRYKKNEISIAKLRIRNKDLKGFIKNRSVLKKVYLSDEPPLTPAGWIKLMLSYGFMILWALIILWPLAELVKATLNENAVKYLNTTADYKFGFASFTRLFNETDFVSWFINTLVVAGITCVATVVLALCMGYAFSRFRFKGKKSSLMSVMLLQMVPAMAALTVFYVMYTILREQFQMSGLTVLILIYVGGGVAGNTFIMKGYMDSISMEIDEAARIDGLSQWKIFTRIIVPLTKPMIALVALWSFIGPFGDFILPGLLLSDSKDFTLAKGLQTLASDPKTQDQGAFAAGAILVAVPISILFISLRNFLVGGMTAGGVKG